MTLSDYILQYTNHEHGVLVATTQVKKGVPYLVLSAPTQDGRLEYLVEGDELIQLNRSYDQKVVSLDC